MNRQIATTTTETGKTVWAFADADGAFRVTVGQNVARGGWKLKRQTTFATEAAAMAAYRRAGGR